MQEAKICILLADRESIVWGETGVFPLRNFLKLTFWNELL